MKHDAKRALSIRAFLVATSHAATASTSARAQPLEPCQHWSRFGLNGIKSLTMAGLRAGQPAGELREPMIPLRPPTRARWVAGSEAGHGEVWIS